MAEILTSTGLKTVALIPADTVFEWALTDKAFSIPTSIYRKHPNGSNLE